MALQIHYNKKGSGPALVLIHGFPDSSRIWNNIANELAAHFTVLTPDLPGSGGTPLTQPTRLPAMADGIMEMLRKEHISRSVIAGHSMGGYTALAFARAYPDALRGLSLVHSTPAADDDEKKANRLKAVELIMNGGKEAFIKQMNVNLFSADFRKNNPAIMQWKADQGMQVGETALDNFYHAMIAREDCTELLRNAVFPVQWILGKEDSIINFAKILPLCHRSPVNFVSLYEGCGHTSMLEHPERLVNDLMEFASWCHRKPDALL
jgi:pimeloyl-ACP methyl ester carboxylesterase